MIRFYYIAFAVLFLLVTLPPTHVSAQQNEGSADTLHSMDVRGESLSDALQDFALKTNKAVGYTASLVKGRVSQCAIEDATADALLACIVKGTGLEVERSEAGTYRLKLAPPPPKSPKAKKTVSGYVRDGRSGEALINAAIYDAVRGVGAITNNYGFYSLTVPVGPTQLRVSYLGFQKAFSAFDLQEDRTQDFNLEPASLGLDTLTVVAEREEPLESRTQMSMIQLPVQQIQQMPALLGEPDLLRAVQLLPGVQSGNEGTTGLFVRGGSVDQNLFLLDGATVYNPSHLFGFLSIFHARALNDVTLIKGGFPARYGGRLSSVLDISMKEGNANKYTGEASLGLAAGSFTIEGPIKKGSSSFIFSGRRSMIDLAMAPFSVSSDYPAYSLFDFNGKINHKFSSKDRIYASFYGGSDSYNQKNEFQSSNDSVTPRNEFNIDWGNRIATVRWNHLFSNKLFSNTTLLYSQYDLGTQQVDVRFRREPSGEYVQERHRLLYESGVRDFGGKLEFEYIPSPSHYVRFGSQVTLHQFKTGTLQLNAGAVNQPVNDTLVVPVSNINTQEVSAYLEDDWKIGRKLSLNLGVHASLYNVDKTTYTDVQPRLAARFAFLEGWALKASWSRMSQYIHMLTNSGLGLPTDLWLPVTEKVKPLDANQVSVGIAHTTPSGIEVSIEAYDKQMDGVIEYKEGASFLGGSRDWQNSVERGEGRARGIELLIQKKEGRTTGWFGYTLSKSDRTFENLNDGETFPFRYDRRHDVSFTVVHKLKDWLSLTGSWVYGTGNAVTMSFTKFSPAIQTDATMQRPIIPEIVHLEKFGSKNGYRMAAYHRLDLGVNFEWDAKRGGKHLMTVGAYNTYNRRNPYFLFTEENLYRGDNTQEPDVLLKQASLFPVLPSFSYAFQF